jgi:hypothetical protein
MKVVLMRRDKTEEYHRAKAENFVINDFLYQFDPNATLHQKKFGLIDNRVIYCVENRTTPVNFFDLESLDAKDSQKLQLMAHDLGKIRAHDEYREMKRSDNTVIWVLVLVIGILAILQIINTVV